MPRITQEVACIARLGTCCLMSWTDDSSSSEKEEDRPTEEEDEEQEENPADMGEPEDVSPEPSPHSAGLEPHPIEPQR